MTEAQIREMPRPQWWEPFLAEIDKLPPQAQPDQLAALARELITRRERGAATQLMLRAWRQLRQSNGAGSPQLRAVLRALTSGYHLQISTDPVRIAAWEAALKAVIRPGMLVLEIGTGTGILAMLAARAGAEVVTCDSDVLIAGMAEETIRENGLADRIRVVAKPVGKLQIPDDLPRPADVLILDLFSDKLLKLNPFGAVADAQRLLQPGAVAVPMRASLEGALAGFKRWSRIVPGEVTGFDLSNLAMLSAAHVGLDAADEDLLFRSPCDIVVGAQLPAHPLMAKGKTEKTFTSDGGPVNGLAMWLRLDLAPGHVLAARPGTAPHGFYAKPNFYAFPKTFDTAPGQSFRVQLQWDGGTVSLTLDD